MGCGRQTSNAGRSCSRLGDIAMCYEDVKMGLRRYAKQTAFAVNTVFPGNKRRVAFRVCATLDVAGANLVLVRPSGISGNQGIMMLIGTNTSDEIWLERHGTLVMDEITVATVVNTVVTEIFDDSLDKAPAAGDPYSKP